MASQVTTVALAAAAAFIIGAFTAQVGSSQGFGTGGSSLGGSPAGQQKLQQPPYTGVVPAAAGAVAAGGSAQLFAVINANGTIARDKGVVTAQKLTTGEYEVIFARNVLNCVHIATIGIATASYAPIGVATSAQRLGQPRGVFVQTRSIAGNSADLPFHLWINC